MERNTIFLNLLILCNFNIYFADCAPLFWQKMANFGFAVKVIIFLQQFVKYNPKFLRFYA